ncbi:MAG TPA: hypothetical protein VF476_03590 [Chitinophagaceae bacterium]
MANETKPIKRSKQLAPLSREHHDGLLFAWKIRQGLNNNSPIEKLRTYTLWFWQHHIKPHFFQEEKILIPFLPVGHPLALQLQNEHAQIRELILHLDKDADKESFTILSDLLDKHIRFEERQLFNYLEEILSPEQLNEIYPQLEAHPVSCEEWKDEFWIRKK